MQRRLRLPPPLAVLTAALLCAAVAPAPAPAAAARTATSARFELVDVNVRGTVGVALDDGADHYTYSGRATYADGNATRGELTIPLSAAKRRALLLPFTATGLTYGGNSDATIVTPTRTWDCGQATPDALEPTSIAAGITFRGDRMRIQWSFFPPPMSCPQGAPAWSIPGIPVAATTRTYSLRQLLAVKRGKNVRIAPGIDSSWSDDGGLHHVSWSGTLRLKRVA
ncbi:hypothetical protein [Conexibacter sp. CPCC 206217]|uniref:hypothetical protein n=1 Tax=Conexibacter sp. CPCC 206217 TaxID=3064574 RepID=UPI002722E2B7|nr:hypothetical protein [Conexibacter sp. CPCC 206217]MDO8211916.1 hypothetical protein [Conexibacter sp. CPCC 206217]